MPDKTIYLMRHGQGVNNTAMTVHGKDAELTDNGREQARRLAERCWRLAIDVVVSSTFRRAEQTAEAICAISGRPHIRSALFGERQIPSTCIGLSKRDPHYLGYLAHFWERFDDPEARYFDAENFADVHVRAAKALRYLVELPQTDIAVVSHGDFSRIAVSSVMLGEALTRPASKAVARSLIMRNTGLTLLRYEEREGRFPWRVDTWNDHSHLG